MLLKMLSSHRVSRNGTHVEHFVQDQVYEVHADLGHMLLRAGWAEHFSPDQHLTEMAEHQTKMHPGSPENKMHTIRKATPKPKPFTKQSQRSRRHP